MSADPLFTPVTLGNLTLKNRIVMAPMTRNRAAEGNIPQAMNVEYYRQRASAGLIITEASCKAGNFGNSIVRGCLKSSTFTV